MRQLVLLLVNARSRVGGYNAGGGYRTTWLAVPVQRPNWSNVIRHRSSPALMSRSEKVRRPLQRPVQLPLTSEVQHGNLIVFRTGPGRLEYRCQSCTADIVVRGAYQGMRRSKSPTLVKRYTRLTSTFADFSCIRFTHLRLLRRTPF